MIEEYHAYITAKICIDGPGSDTYMMKWSQARYWSDSAVAPLWKFNLLVSPYYFFSSGRYCCIVGAS